LLNAWLIVCVYIFKFIDIFFIVSIHFLGGWQPRKELPRKQLNTLAIEGRQGNTFLRRSSIAKKSINLAVVNRQEKLLTWRFPTAKKNN